jgi:hypothetical protein
MYLERNGRDLACHCSPVNPARTDHRCYGDLATWWPLISPPEEYVEEAVFSIPVREERTPRELSAGHHPST